MANFRAYPGLFIVIMEDIPKGLHNEAIKVGEILQILSVPRYYADGYAFVGKNGLYSKKIRMGPIKNV